jgi:hypothetical protein
VVSQVADGEAELTEAMDGERTRRWGFGERRRGYLVACTEREGGERAQLEAQMNGGRWASGVRASKMARAQERGRRTRSRGRVHGEGRGREVGEAEGADGWGPQDRERESGRVGKGMALTGRPHRAARGRESKSARVGTD